MRQIGEVASRVGLSLRTVRYYGEVGLVVPSGRTEGGFRLYTDADVDRLALIKQLKPLDFTLDELGDLLSLRDQLLDPHLDPRDRAALAGRLAGYLEVAEQRCAALREQLSQAEAVTRRLSREVHDLRAGRA